MIIKAIFSFVYFLLKSLVLLYQYFYFPFTKVVNKKGFDFSGPAILVSNHPNTLMDPFNAISRVPNRVYPLANSSIFKPPIVAAIFNQLAIPIFRPGQDDTKLKVDNNQSFKRAFEHLTKGGIIYIAPEGGSYEGRRLNPIKTGTARIVLGAESENDFNLGVKIIPVGVNYDHPNHCGHRLYIEVGQPIFAKDWESDFLKNPKDASRKMTDEIKHQMQALLIHTEDDEQDQLLYRLQTILQNDQPLDIQKNYNRTQQLLKGLKSLKKTNKSTYQKLVDTTTNYRHVIKENGITDDGIGARKKALFTPFSILGWPLCLYGRINNFIALEIPRWLVKKLDLYIGYTSTVKILSGLFTFPIAYFLQYKLVQSITSQPIAWLYLLSLPTSAVFYSWYLRYSQPRLGAYKWRKWAKEHSQKAQDIMNERGELFQTASHLSTPSHS